MREDTKVDPRASGLGAPDPANAVAQLAHELRSPLATMRMATDLLDGDLTHLDTEQIRALAATVARSTRWLQQLMERLASDGMWADDLAAAPRHPLDLRAVLLEVEPLVHPQLAAKAQQLVLPPETPLPPIVGTPQQLGQVWINLLLNASKFADEHTRIQVSLTCMDDRLRAAVEDRGPGFPEGCAERLFEPYYQASTPVPAQQRGVGLGLAIVQQIISAYGGRVGAENRRGGGAR